MLGQILSILAAVSTLVEMFARQKIINETEARIVNENIANATEAIKRAQQARTAALNEFDSNGGVQNDKKDPYLRD